MPTYLKPTRNHIRQSCSADRLNDLEAYTGRPYYRNYTDFADYWEDESISLGPCEPRITKPDDSARAIKRIAEKHRNELVGKLPNVSTHELQKALEAISRTCPNCHMSIPTGHATCPDC